MVHKTVSLAKRRFHGFMRPMKLKASVRMSRKTSSNPPCLAEMTAVMACWKVNSFEDVPCKKEIEDFVQCMEAARQAPETLKPQEQSRGYKWTTEEVNAKLRKFVWPQ